MILTPSRFIKVKSYASIQGFTEFLNDLKYLLRRSFLGLPRIDLLELFELEAQDFELVLPNYSHNSSRNASLNITEKVAIALICHSLKPKSIVEIGTFRGETTDLIARNTYDADIYTLDLPPDFKQHRERPDIDDLEVLKLRNPELYIQPTYPTKSRIHQLYGDSAEFQFDRLQRTFDLVFIDGAHSYEYVKNDTEKLLPSIEPGGWLVWDDYSFNFPEVIQYANTFRNRGAFQIYGTRLAALKV
jgi:predicted O-methyltransferase YrrM